MCTCRGQKDDSGSEVFAIDPVNLTHRTHRAKEENQILRAVPRPPYMQTKCTLTCTQTHAHT